MHVGMDGMRGELVLDGAIVATDFTPPVGVEATRNHVLNASLPDGRALRVEAGYINWLTVGIAADLDGTRIHESHPGKPIVYPARAARMAIKAGEKGTKGTLADDTYDLGVYRRNRVPIAIDIALALLFFVVAKMTDLRTAALVGAGVGIALVVVQRFIRTDILGGMALFGIAMALVSAGLAWAFEDDMAVKMRTTIVGLISATLFLGDGFLFAGRRLGQGMARYLPFGDVDPARLAIGIGAVGLIMAGLNTIVALVASTNVWLVYHSFLDTFVVAALMLGVFKYARVGAVGHEGGAFAKGGRRAAKP